MNFKIQFTLAVLGFSYFVNAQNTIDNSSNFEVKNRCATQVPPAQWDTWFNQKVEENKTKMAKGSVQFYSYTIPVIVHVIHGGQSVGSFPNVSVAQVKSQIDVLNRDFAGNGQNVNQLAATAFSAVGAANCYITFCLAQFDPSGNPLAQAGIDRQNYVTAGWTNPTTPTNFANFQTLMDGTIKPATIWDPSKYLNIWISDVNNNVGLLGYATFPAGSGLTGLPTVGTAQTDGIWVWARSFGNTGAVQSPYHLGRTASHELGHWLGLRHIGGDGNGNLTGDCNATDYCADTPPQKGGNAGGQYGQNYGAPSYPLHANTCSPNDPNGDMFMNFMDYSDDPSCYMFTPDQQARIQAAMENGLYRNQLSASSVSLCVGVASSDFYINPTNCIGQEIQVSNQTTGNASLNYTWTASPDSAVVFSPNSNDPNPTINFPVAGTYTISLIASNSIGISTSYTVVDLADCVGLRENSFLQANISLVPNPSSGMVSLKTNFDKSQNLEVTIYNSLGETVFKNSYLNVSNNTLNLNAEKLAVGLYSVMISNTAEKTVKRLVISK